MTGPAVETVELPLQTRQARFEPKSADAEARTIELTWTTGATVRRRDWFGDAWDEQLMLDEGAVRMDRLNNGASLLDSHSGHQLSSVLGIVEKAWLVGKGNSREGRAIVRFSERAEVEPIWKDVRAGIIRNVSVGYAIHKVEKTEKADEKIPLVRVVDWEPMELSMVAIPADAGAQVRSQEQRYSCVVERTAPMADQATSAATNEVAEQHDKAPPKNPEAERKAEKSAERSKDATEDRAEKLGEQRAEQKANGHANGEARSQPVAPVQTGPTEAEIQARIDAAIRGEQERANRINEACRVLKLEPEIGEQLIKEKVSLDVATSALFAEAAKRDQARQIVERVPSRVESGAQDEETVRMRSIASSLLHRYNPAAFKLEYDGARYVGFSLVELARHCLESAGVRTTGMHKTDLADKALIPGYGIRGGSGYHTTSDFVAVLADVANKTLRQAYDEAPRTFTPIARRVTASDFRNVNRTQIGEMPNLLLVTEHGEYKRVTMSDAKETYALKTYGAVFAVTRQVLINDDLDAFTRMPQKFGASAARTESNIVWGVITANAAMGDGTALFHANHGNLIASGSGAPSVANIGAARAKMRVQTGLDGTTNINVEPRYLVVPAALETVAEQFLAGNFFPATQATIVPERMRASLSLVVEPRLDAASTTAWYLFASPGDIDTIEYAYLAGEEGVSITTRNGFDIDGLEIKASLDFGAKAIDHRGMLRSDGVT